MTTKKPPTAAELATAAMEQDIVDQLAEKYTTAQLARAALQRAASEGQTPEGALNVIRALAGVADAEPAPIGLPGPPNPG